VTGFLQAFGLVWRSPQAQGATGEAEFAQATEELDFEGSPYVTGFLSRGK